MLEGSSLTTRRHDEKRAKIYTTINACKCLKKEERKANV
jgi:hypothetical protein